MDTVEVVYQVSCKQCPKTYIGETGRKLGIRIKEHRDDVGQSDQSHYTRSQRKTSTDTIHKSALTDHASQNNHVIDWDNTKVVGRESNRERRWMRESIRIRQEGTKALNRDKGNHDLPHLWDRLLTEAANPPVQSITSVCRRPLN